MDMLESELLNKLNNPKWDYSKDYEYLEEEKSWRYKTSILYNLPHFFIGTLEIDRGKGYAKELLKRVLKENLNEYIQTTIKCEDKLGMQKLLQQFGFEYHKRYKVWVNKRREKKWHEDEKQWNAEYCFAEYVNLNHKL